MTAPPALNPVEKPGYHLVWHDEFDGPAFDDNLWNRENYFGLAADSTTLVDNLYHTYPDPAQSNYVFVREPSGNGVLHLVARRQAPPYSMHSVNQHEGYNLGAEARPYTSAAFDSREPIKYGYLEARFRLPDVPLRHDGLGVLSAFWTFLSGDPFGYREGKGLEIDIFEIFSHCPQLWHTNTWSYGWPCTCESIRGMDPWGQYKSTEGHACAFDGTFQLDTDLTPSATGGFHTYGLEWGPKQLHFYLDNVLVRSITHHCQVPEVFSRVIIGLAVGSKRPNICEAPTSATFPDTASLELDYFRLYKRILSTEVGNGPGSTLQWLPSHARLLTDGNGDGRADIFAFHGGNAYFASGYQAPTGLGFANLQNIEEPGLANVTTHHRVPAQVNADRKTDFITFIDQGVSVFLSSPTPTVSMSYREHSTVLPWFGTLPQAGGWNGPQRPRLVGDINGDALDDIIGFDDRGVLVALAQASPILYGDTLRWSFAFGESPEAGAWDGTRHRRKLADVDGDGRKDIVGFHDTGIFVGRSTGHSFEPPVAWLGNFDPSLEWHPDSSLIIFQDIDGDRKADLIGFGAFGTMVAMSAGDHFEAPVLQFPQMGHRPGSTAAWNRDQHPRKVGDVTGDGIADIIGWGPEGVMLAEGRAFPSEGRTFFLPRLWYNEMGTAQGWTADHPRQLTDFNADGILDVAGFGEMGLFGHESPGCAYPDPCHPQHDPSIMTTPLAWDTLRVAPGLGPQELELTVAPNPSADFFTIRYHETSTAPATITLLDALGRRVAMAPGMLNQTDGRILLDMRGHPAGVYLLRVEKGQHAGTVKLLKP